MLQISSPRLTVGQVEKWGSMVGGGMLLVYGLTRRSLGGIALALLGGDLIYHGLEGHLMDLVQTPMAQPPAMTIPHGHGIKIQRSITINRSPQELYEFWRNLENLPRIFSHLETVQVQDDLHSHWVAKAPAGLKAEWDAEIINDIPKQLIGWRSLEDADVPNAGSVHFEKSPRGKETRVIVILKYDQPAGPMGAAFASLFGEAPSQTIREDLQRPKRALESETPTRRRRTKSATGG